MTAEEWLERDYPLDCLDPITGKVSRAVLVSVEIGPDEVEENSEAA